MAVKGQYIYEWPRPMVTVDAVVYVLADNAIQFLLIQRGHEPFRGKWAFPGGFIEMDEELEQAVARELAEETGLKGIALEPMHTFGTVGRDPRGRTISIAFLGQARPDQMAVMAGDDADRAAWFDFDAFPPMAFDHDRMAAVAMDHIRRRHTL
ncbi:MAG: NUDIX hydrolase [Sedimentisphaerales bacterium]|nr:NUDIX hydrolase [Sedimentisphaerales bacterium]